MDDKPIAECWTCLASCQRIVNGNSVCGPCRSGVILLGYGITQHDRIVLEPLYSGGKLHPLLLVSEAESDEHERIGHDVRPVAGKGGA